MLREQISYWGITPDHSLAVENNGNLVRLFANTLTELQKLIDQYSCLEYILVQGDTNTALACANLSFLNRKKLLHLEAGLRTHDFAHPFPEEYNRLLVSKVAYFHFAHTENAKNNLIGEGVDQSRIMVCGNTVIDALKMATDKIGHSKNPEETDVIITAHRRETSGSITKLGSLATNLKTQFPLLNFKWVKHPNYSPENLTAVESLRNIQVVPFLPYEEFVQMYSTAKIVITDSGGVTEEASQLGLPVVVYRMRNERNEPAEQGHPMLVSMDDAAISDFFSKHIGHTSDVNNYFGNGNASIMVSNWICRNL